MSIMEVRIKSLTLTKIGSANSKYAFLGSLRSTAAMISYELILSSCVLIIIFLTGSFNYTKIIEAQQAI